MSTRSRDRAVAFGLGLLTHTSFAGAIGSMAWALATGLQLGRGRLHGPTALAVDVLLALQFPVLHSLLLTARGRRWLPRMPRQPDGRIDRRLDVTFYALIASLQLLLTFWAWSPSGVVWHKPHGVAGSTQWLLFVVAWMILARAIADAGLGLQTGASGWLAVVRQRAVDYGGMPEGGLFRLCRQPIYLGFTLVLFTAPTWTPDVLLLASSWGAYCWIGPLHKEARWLARYGARFAAYRAALPYMLPRFRR